MKAPPGLHIRNVEISGIGPWLWREADHWGWEHPKAGYRGIRDLILAHTQQRRCVVQAGGCMGMYPRLLSEHFAHVITFEPDPVNFYCLVANCPSERITKLQMALADRPALCALKAGPDFNAGFGSVCPDDAGAILSLPLDALALPIVDAMQLDCEGYEDKIIEGARETIARCHPVIVIERPSKSLREVLSALEYIEVGQCGTMPDVAFAPR